MIEIAANDPSASTETVLGSPQMLLDYAIVEDPELHLPANRELAKSARRKLTLSSDTLYAANERVAS